ncbi:MAG: histidine kinase [Bryobacteraceae bacterium]
MRLRSWPVLALGFGAVLLVAALWGLENRRTVLGVYDSMREMRRTHARAEAALRDIQSGIYRSDIFVRDFLLDPSQITADLHRRELLTLHAGMNARLEEIGKLGIADATLLDQLRKEIDEYWQSRDAIFDWTPEQRRALSFWYLRKQVLPRRQAALEVATQAQKLNAADLRAQEAEMERAMSTHRRRGDVLLGVVLGSGLLIAGVSMRRISRLEARAQQQHARTEQAERELRRLSQQLVHAQEEERRRISRELHDEVGQTLTGLRLELRNLEKLRSGSESDFHAHLEAARELASGTLQSVRSLAAGLRPSVLDDLGLAPALEWLAREFTRRTRIPVEVLVEGLPPELPEAHRTCIYRVVQEALTNCAKHAEARQIRVALHGDGTRLSLAVNDDGRGFSMEAAGRGLGLIGIGERVRELGGTVTVHSQPGKGALLKVAIPLSGEPA